MVFFGGEKNKGKERGDRVWKMSKLEIMWYRVRLLYLWLWIRDSRSVIVCSKDEQFNTRHVQTTLDRQTDRRKGSKAKLTQSVK